jgi:hypothetical protein
VTGAREELAREGVERRARLGERLEVDPLTASKIGWLLDVIDLGLDGARMYVERSEAMDAFIAERLVQRDRAGAALDTDTLLAEASALLERARPALGRYEARKAVWAAWRAARDAATERPRYVRAEDRLVVPRDAPAPPASDPTWRDYRSLYAPAEVIRAPSSALPDGAILPMVRCLSLATNEHSYSGTAPDDELVAVQLRRYGDRVYPALLEALSDPARYAWGGGAAQLRACAFSLAAGFGAETRLAFVRIALESGWNDALHVLPDGDEKTRLRADYADSPYGPP